MTTAAHAREVFGHALDQAGGDRRGRHAHSRRLLGLVEAAGILAADGFEVFPYATEDLVVAERLMEAGCRVLMPWGALIGGGAASTVYMA